MTMSLAYKTMESPVGQLKLVASDKGLVAILWENDRPRRVQLDELAVDERHPVLVETERQLREYFAGKRKTFSVALDMRGTHFQKDVWEALLWRACDTTGESASDTRGGSGEWKKSDFDHCAVSPCDWVVWKAHRLCGWVGDEGPTIEA
jgi:hypothetical protein